MDGLLASCYASYPHHLAHAALAPARLLPTGCVTLNIMSGCFCNSVKFNVWVLRGLQQLGLDITLKRATRSYDTICCRLLLVEENAEGTAPYVKMIKSIGNLLNLRGAPASGQ